MGVLGLRYAILILLVLAGASLVLRLLGGSTAEPSEITSFEQCTAAGYPVMESYPRQCKTPDGETFVSQTDLFDSLINVSCTKDEDCALVNHDRGFGCCYSGACERIDYSQDSWVAVNADWFAEQQARICPPTEACGTAPACNPQPRNDKFEAKCVTSICQKVAK